MQSGRLHEACVGRRVQVRGGGGGGGEGGRGTRSREQPGREKAENSYKLKIRGKVGIFRNYEGQGRCMRGFKDANGMLEA